MSNDNNLFEQAARKAFRFPSIKGFVTVEHLWDLPLQSKSGFDLDSVAKAINAELKEQKEESFVTTASTPYKAELEVKLDILKHIIAVKQAENEAARSLLARKAEREKLLEILEGKKTEGLNALSVADIEARIAALS